MKGEITHLSKIIVPSGANVNIKPAHIAIPAIYGITFADFGCPASQASPLTRKSRILSFNLGLVVGWVNSVTYSN